MWLYLSLTLDVHFQKMSMFPMKQDMTHLCVALVSGFRGRPYCPFDTPNRIIQRLHDGKMSDYVVGIIMNVFSSHSR